MENKLIPLSTFVMNIEMFNDCREDDFAVVYNYASFLKKPLRLDMFVEIDDKGNVLGTYDPGNEDSKVLFEGFEIEMSKNRVDIYFSNYNHISYSRIQNNFSSPSKLLTTIEDLIIYSGLILTETAKQIYGS